MQKMEPKTGPDGQEKHLPVIKKVGNNVIIKVGSISHPMIEEHYIEWIEIIVGDMIQRTFLKPGDEPIAKFEITNTNQEIIVRAYCNIHGLWSAKI